MALRIALVVSGVLIKSIAAEDMRPLNVLMIAVDDLRPSGAAFAHEEILVPNIDKLATRGTTFTEAFVQAATCGVSRSSLLTSRRPDSTYVLSNGQCPFSTATSHSTWQSIPEVFRASGYITAGMGKIFHPNTCDGAAAGERKAAWTLPYYHAPCISLGSIYNGTCYESYPGPLPAGKGGKVTSIFSNASVSATDETMPDGMIAAKAVETVRTLADQNKPFFLAVGFHKPHLPHIAPKKYFDLYPLDQITLPSNASRHNSANAPEIAWNSCSEMLSYHDTQQDFKADGFSRVNPVGDDLARKQRQAYYAAASFTDAQIGKVLDALDENNLTSSTVIALWGDHGWHLGENNEWAKHTAKTWANRAPLIFVTPRQPEPGSKSAAYAEFVDIMPTLVDLAGLKALDFCENEFMSQTSPNCTEGRSLKGVVMGDQMTLSAEAAFSQWPRDDKMAYNIFTTTTDGSRIRYTEWVGYKNHGPVWTNLAGVELYNHSADPNENVNIANDPELAAEVARLSSQLHMGWRQA